MTAGDTDDAMGHLAAAALIARFGGVRPMAGRLGVPVSTVQGWKQRDAIPLGRREQIRAAAAGHGIVLDETLLAAVDGPSPVAVRPAMPDAAAPARTIDASALARSPAFAARALAALAVVLGGVALAGVLQPSLLGIKPPRGPTLAPLERRIAALETRPATTPDTKAPDVKALSDRLDAMAAKLDETAAGAAEARRIAGSAAGDPAALAALGGRLAALEQNLAMAAIDRRDMAQRLQLAIQAQERAASTGDVEALAARLAAAERDVARLGELERRLVALETAAQAHGAARGDVAAWALVAASLRRAVVAGEAFADVLALARRFAGDDAATVAALDRLAPVAATGVPAEAELRAAFAAADRAARAALRAPATPSWTDRALARLDGVVTVHRNAPQDGTPDAALVRAAERLAAGDVAGADAALATLDGAAATAVAAWRERAHRRLEAAGAAAALEARSLERVAAGS